MKSYAEIVRQAPRLQAELYRPDLLNISGVVPGMLGDGYGVRCGLFLQGCMRYCHGCRNNREARLTLGRRLTAAQVMDSIEQIPALYLPAGEGGREPAYVRALRLLTAVHVIDALLRAPLTEASVQGWPASDYVRGLEKLRRAIAHLPRARPLSECPDGATPVEIDGLTLSGGEPLLQIPALLELLSLVAARRPRWSVWLYTAHSFADLSRHDATRALLACVAVVKSGPFSLRQEGAHFYFGSRNQVLLDARASLAAGRPVPFVLPEPVASAQARLEELLAERATVALATPVLRTLRDGRLERRFASFEQVEQILGPLDADFLGRLFAPGVRSRRAARTRGPEAFEFVRAGELNVHSIVSSPLLLREGPAVELWLQGTERPPAAGHSPSYTSLQPWSVLPTSAILERTLSDSWHLRTRRAGDEGLAAWMALALLAHLLKVQTRYGLLASPARTVSLADYLEGAARCRAALGRLLVKRQHGDAIPSDSYPVRPRILAIVGGDPLLQRDGVLQLARAAQASGLEVWLEIPYPWRRVERDGAARELAAAADIVVSGTPGRAAAPPVNPLLFARGQEVRHGDTGAPWKPRFAWSQQLESLLRRPRALATLAPLPALAAATRAESAALTLEELDAFLGVSVVDWQQER